MNKLVFPLVNLYKIKKNIDNESFNIQYMLIYIIDKIKKLKNNKQIILNELSQLSNNINNDIHQLNNYFKKILHLQSGGVSATFSGLILNTL